jgi:RNA polymerase sigma-70 factor (ECF subfamily)
MPADPQQLALEAKARAACEAGDHDRGMTHLIEAYGAELLRFLAVRMGDPDAASEVYSDVVERLWRNLPRFEWRNGARGYCYAIARNAAINHGKAAGRRPERNLALSLAGASAMAERVRTATMPFLRTEVKDRFRALREQLSSEDQMLLTLRLDRGLEWRELALIMMHDGDGDAPGEAELTREAARLRQRFKTAKDKLKAYAEREGML